MTSNDFIKNSAKIFECASSFRHDANYLMFELAKDNNFEITKGGGFTEEVYQHKSNNKGLFREDWTYFFHGSECRFDNLITGQIVELIYIRMPEFGFLDGYFLFNYMQTTERFKSLANWFGTHQNVWDAMDELASKKILTIMPHHLSKRNLIAL